MPPLPYDRCSWQQFKAICQRGQQCDEPPRGLALASGAGVRAMLRVEISAMKDGREAWLAGLEEPDPGAFLQADYQRLYEEAYYAEIYDCVAAVRALGKPY